MTTRSALGRLISGVARRPRDVARAVLALGLLAGFGAVGTMATFGDGGAVTTEIQTGTVSLRLDGQVAPISQRYQFTQLGQTPLTSTSVGYAALAVSNAGTIAAQYGLSVATITETGGVNPSTPIQQYVLTTVAVGATSCDAAGWASGTVIVPEQPLPGVTITGRALAGSGVENLCFKTRLDTSPAQFAILTGPSGIAMSVDLNVTANQAP